MIQLQVDICILDTILMLPEFGPKSGALATVERADLLALVCGVFCEFVTFPLVSWVRCGT